MKRNLHLITSIVTAVVWLRSHEFSFRDRDTNIVCVSEAGRKLPGVKFTSELSLGT